MSSTSGWVGGRSRAGFTLVELLVVLLIISVLVGLMLASIGRSRVTARSLRCLAQLREIQLSARVYADGYRRLPVVMPEKPVREFELPGRAWRCPADKTGASVPEHEPFSAYTYLAVYYMDPPPTGLDLAKLKPAVGLRRYEMNPGLPLYWDQGEVHEEQRNVVYWNGSARRWVD
ncbi:MAG TPA: prepilin-type N-terminal cleavage/methylation domain-containing protein [Phycisphaerales bacterium]|nr:prepilin-type N-terminal cleavage/methylation domain-containing protein [Phycisphaerales bacterium]